MLGNCAPTMVLRQFSVLLLDDIVNYYRYDYIKILVFFIDRCLQSYNIVACEHVARI